MDVYTYKAHGLSVSCEFELGALHGSTGSEPDVTIVRGNPDLRTGELVAASSGEDLTTTIHGTADGYLLDFTGRHRVGVSTDGSSVVVSSEGPDFELVSVVEGAVLAFVQLLRGSLALHAASVEIGGAGVALMGHRRSGKSTIAAVACARGARLLSDDVTVIGGDSARPTLFRGSARLRLRHDAAVVASLFPGDRLVADEDGRTVVAPPVGPPAVELARLVVVTSAAGVRPVLEACRAVDAFGVLMGNLRTSGLVHPGLLGSQFDLVGSLLESYVVEMLHVPSVVDPDDVAAVLLG